MANDYYSVLGVARNASDKDIRQAYRRLARKYHPDVNPSDKDAESKFKEINAAYEVISDPEKRKKYDQFGENWKHVDQFSQAGYGGGPSFWRGARTGGTVFDFGGMSDPGFGSVFEEIIGGRQHRGRSRNAVWNPPVEVPLELDLEEAYTGVTRIVQMPAVAGSPAKRLEVKVPPGVDTGSKVHASADRIDLYLVVKLRPHRRFTRKGADLYVDLPVPLVDAILGSEQEIQTIQAKVMLTIPPESQNGQVFRLGNHGMPRLNDPNSRGFLFAALKVVLPTSLSEREHELILELKSIRGTTEVQQ